MIANPLFAKNSPRKFFMKKVASMFIIGFWFFVSVLLVCDTWLFSKGYESFFWTAKTDAEKAIHKKAGEQ